MFENKGRKMVVTVGWESWVKYVYVVYFKKDIVILRGKYLRFKLVFYMFWKIRFICFGFSGRSVFKMFTKYLKVKYSKC